MSLLTSRVSLFARQSIWASLNALQSLIQSDSSHCVVLTYHRVTNELKWSDPLVVTPDQFACQVEFIKKRLRLLSASEVAEIIRSRKPFPGRSCLITFDDGWRDNYTEAFPVLQSYRAPAIVFLTTDYISTNKRFWHERLASILYSLPFSKKPSRPIASTYASNELSRLTHMIQCIPVKSRDHIIATVTEEWKAFSSETIEANIEELAALSGSRNGSFPAMLSWEEVATMASAGIEFGSHTKSHALLDRIGPKQIREELHSSKEIIASKLGMPVDFIAYPNGNYNDVVVEISREVGYVGGFTCDVGFNANSEHPFVLKRKHVLNDLSLGLNGRFSPMFFAAELSGIRHRVKARIKRVPPASTEGRG